MLKNVVLKVVIVTDRCRHAHDEMSSTPRVMLVDAGYVCVERFVMSPAWISGVKLENADAIWRGEGLARSGVEHHILKHGVLRAIVSLEFAGHVAESVFPHIEIGSVKPMLIGILIGHNHF